VAQQDAPILMDGSMVLDRQYIHNRFWTKVSGLMRRYSAVACQKAVIENSEEAAFGGITTMKQESKN
jgi:hypothetical protein